MAEDDDRTYELEVENEVSGFFLGVFLFEMKLKSFCARHGLNVAVGKSGFVFRTLSFRVTGSGSRAFVNDMAWKLQLLLWKHAY